MCNKYAEEACEICGPEYDKCCLDGLRTDLLDGRTYCDKCEPDLTNAVQAHLDYADAAAAAGVSASLYVYRKLCGVVCAVGGEHGVRTYADAAAAAVPADRRIRRVAFVTALSADDLADLGRAALAADAAAAGDQMVVRDASSQAGGDVAAAGAGAAAAAAAVAGVGAFTLSQSTMNFVLSCVCHAGDDAGDPPVASRTRSGGDGGAGD